MSGPPELPLFSAALVWISGMEVRLVSWISRLTEETIPSVKVPPISMSRGVPMAYTGSPTDKASEFPNSAKGRASSALIFSTARSYPASLAIYFAA